MTRMSRDKPEILSSYFRFYTRKKSGIKYNKVTLENKTSSFLELKISWEIGFFTQWQPRILSFLVTNSFFKNEKNINKDKMLSIRLSFAVV